MRAAVPQGSGYVAGSSHVLAGRLVRSLDLGTATRASPAVVNGVLYIGGHFKINAIDESTGQTLWERPVNGPVHGTPAVAGKNVYVPLLEKRILALDTESGRVNWEFRADSPLLGSAVVDSGIVYFGSQDGYVYALDAVSGKQIWKLSTGSSVTQPIAVYEGKVVAGSLAGALFVRNSKTGDKRLRIRTGASLVKPPVVGNGLIYVLSGGQLLAFDADARELPGQYPLSLVWSQLWLWQVPVPRPPVQPGFEWRVALPEGMGAYQDVPAVTLEALYLPSNMAGIYALDPQRGDVLWQFQASATVSARPIAVGGMLYFGADDGTIFAIDRFSGEFQWSLSLDAPLSGPLSYASESLYAPTIDGKLHIIR